KKETASRIKLSRGSRMSVDLTLAEHVKNVLSTKNIESFSAGGHSHIHLRDSTSLTSRVLAV
ncbi:MAG: hypothetical protein ACK53Y_21880, partial [bacterium]